MASPFREVWKRVEGYVFTTGDNHTIIEQLDFHNAATIDYPEMQLDMSRFETAVLIENVLAPSLCLYMHTSEGTMIGFSRTGLHGRRAWLPGIILIPEYRGRGLGTMLFTAYLELLKTRSSIDLLQFHCEEQNARALKMYQNVGCVVDDGTYNLYQIAIVDPEPQGESHLDLTVETTNIDLQLPWLQHTIAYSWPREFNMMLRGGNRQHTFRRASSGVLLLAVVVNATREPPRVNGFAYDESPSTEEFMCCMRKLASKLQVSKFTIVDEPSTSDITSLLDAVGTRDETPHMLLTFAFERA